MRKTDKFIITSVSLVAFTILSEVFLMSNKVSADESSTNNVAVTIPVACTMSGTGMNSHSATIPNGTYQADIGTTTLKVLCNDNNGFAIYAAGYTGDLIGGENSNKLIGAPTTIGNIATGTATSGSTSNWAMKLATSSSATYALTLDNGFGGVNDE